MGQVSERLNKSHSYDPEINKFTKIAPPEKEDTAKTRDILVATVKHAEVAEVKHDVFRALTRSRAATTTIELDTIARLGAQAINTCNNAHRTVERTVASLMSQTQKKVTEVIQVTVQDCISERIVEPD